MRCDLRRGLKWRLSAWKSSDDSCHGDFTYGIELVKFVYRHLYAEEVYYIYGDPRFFLWFGDLYDIRTAFAVVNTIRPSEFMRDNNTALLVSKEGKFELGFFTPTDSSSNNRYLGIWYKNIAVQTVVWVANRCEPIIDSSALLTIDNTGNLVLFSGKNNKSVLIWSTNSLKQTREPLIQLLNNGNLVLRDEKDANTTKFLWESFDYPTDTMLPGMKLGWDLKRGLNRRLSSWKSSDDPCHGDFTYGIELDEPHHDGLYNFVNNDDEVYYSFSLLNGSNIVRLVLTETVEYTEWLEEENSWSSSYYTIPGDKCDKYGICGANSECIITNNQVCKCLEGFKPKNQENWNSMMSWSEGCVRNSSVSCDTKEKDVLLGFSGLKVPDSQYI
ncbi:S-locus-specific glycoprotein S13-like [Cannabis sativa]|uniref:S-locus-specific glycoprotein S13-like n=1 Tax=Cannabis sativa TaxID=3483 RepID=UPI0029C9E4E2|nr:S-locus-specific glycoprotein S13-like [Cannabis sativa]